MFGTYKVCEAIDKTQEQQDYERRGALAEERYYNRPLHTTTTEHKPKPKKEEEEEEGPEWNNGFDPEAVGYGTYERYERNRGVSQAGSRRSQLKPNKYQPGRNVATRINGREYTDHALDSMQNRGLMPSVVENTIQTGHVSPGKPGRLEYFDPINNMKVVVENGKVITAHPGGKIKY